MKKSNILGLIALGLGFIAFILMAAPCCTIANEGDTGNVFDYAFGTQTLRQEAGFLVIFIALLVGEIFLGVGILIKLFTPSPSYAAFLIFGALLFLIGGVAFFNVRNIMADFAAEVNRQYSSDDYKSVLSLKAGPILGGLLSLATAALSGSVEPVALHLDNAPKKNPIPAPQSNPPQDATKQEVPSTEDKKAAEIKAYHDLYQSGAITADEYEKKKKEIL